MDSNSDSIYLHAILANAPGHPLLWNRFLATLAERLYCDSSALLATHLVDSSKTRFLYSAHIPEKYQEQYENKLNRLDRFNHFISKNPGHIFYNQTLDIGYEEGLHNQFTAPCGQQHRFGVGIVCNQNYALSLLLNRKAAFNDREQQRIIEVLQSTLPHLDQAMHQDQRHKINSQLRHHLGDPFDGYIIVDQNLNILFSDPVYTAIISQLDCVTISENRFGMKSPVLEQRLFALMQTKQDSASIHNQCQSCRISLIPIAGLKNLYQWECFKEGFIITFTHESGKNPALDRLMDIYQLSRCEASCALHFMRTPAITDIASTTYRSQETVRNHIKHVMRKMNVHSQAELMKKLIALASL